MILTYGVVSFVLWFFLEVVLISSSGALSPGPLSTSAIFMGLKRDWRSGVGVAVGHSIVEFPLITLLALGLYSIITNGLFVLLLGVVGGGFLAFLGFLMVRDAFHVGSNDNTFSNVHDNPIIVGITLTGLNPYFILWWFLVGGILIIDALNLFGLFGVVILFVFHVWMDYAWLTLLAYMGHFGKNLLNTRGYRLFLGVIGVLFFLYAINLILKVLLGVSILPF